MPKMLMNASGIGAHVTVVLSIRKQLIIRQVSEARDADTD